MTISPVAGCSTRRGCPMAKVILEPIGDSRGSNVGQLRSQVRFRTGAHLTREPECRHGVRPRPRSVGRGHRQRQHGRLRAPGGPRHRRRSSARRRSRCACDLPWSTSSIAPGCTCRSSRTRFRGRTGAGAIFRMNSLLSAAGVPQIAGVHGDCIAGGGYMPIISDVVYMTEQAYMVIAGAALIKGAKSKKITSLSIGGPDVHVHLSRCADHRVPDDEVLLRRLREEMARSCPGRPATTTATAPRVPRRRARQPHELDGLFPVDHRMGYDMRQVLARLVDHSLFWEVLPGRGRDDLRRGPGQRPVRRLIANNPGADRSPVHARPSGRGGSSTARASPRSPSSRGPATTTGSRSSGCRTSPASTSGSRRRSRVCWATART